VRTNLKTRPRDTDGADRVGNFHPRGTILLALGILVAIVWWPNWRTYPVVRSAEGQKLIKMLYTACNTKNYARLDEFERRLAQASEQRQVTPSEEAAFRKVVAMARRGEWDAATQASFQFAKDQAR
jgi:hypothetical protein